MSRPKTLQELGNDVAAVRALLVEHERIMATLADQLWTLRARICELEDMHAQPPAPPKARRPGKIIDFASARRA